MPSEPNTPQPQRWTQQQIDELKRKAKEYVGNLPAAELQAVQRLPVGKFNWEQEVPRPSPEPRLDIDALEKKLAEIKRDWKLPVFTIAEIAGLIAEVRELREQKDNLKLLDDKVINALRQQLAAAQAENRRLLAENERLRDTIERGNEQYRALQYKLDAALAQT